MIEQRLILQNVMFRVPIECGVLEPYKCRCNDGRYYYVKGQYAGAQECIRELVCAEIGHRFGLPVPEFGIVDTKDISNSNPEIGKSLQGMPAFGSLEVKDCTEYLCKENTSKTYKEIYSKILFFDWWVQNPDRTKGHTNLLKTPDGRIWVIDHNMALCNGIGENIEAFKNEHALGDFGELFTFQPETYIHEMDEIMLHWDEIRDNVPEEWIERCSNNGILEDIETTLRRYRSRPGSFWERRQGQC